VVRNPAIFLNIATNVKGKFTLEQAMKTQKGCQVIATNILLPRRWMGWLANVMLPTIYLQETDTVSIVQKSEVSPKADLDWCGKIPSHQNSIPGPSNP
jgi:hypothetical protein